MGYSVQVVEAEHVRIDRERAHEALAWIAAYSSNDRFADKRDWAAYVAGMSVDSQGWEMDAVSTLLDVMYDLDIEAETTDLVWSSSQLAYVRTPEDWIVLKGLRTDRFNDEHLRIAFSAMAAAGAPDAQWVLVGEDAETVGIAVRSGRAAMYSVSFQMVGEGW